MNVKIIARQNIDIFETQTHTVYNQVGEVGRQAHQSWLPSKW